MQMTEVGVELQKGKEVSINLLLLFSVAARLNSSCRFLRLPLKSLICLAPNRLSEGVEKIIKKNNKDQVSERNKHFN